MSVDALYIFDASYSIPMYTARANSQQYIGDKTLGELLTLFRTYDNTTNGIVIYNKYNIDGWADFAGLSISNASAYHIGDNALSGSAGQGYQYCYAEKTGINGKRLFYEPNGDVTQSTSGFSNETIDGILYGRNDDAPPIFYIDLASFTNDLYINGALYAPTYTSNGGGATHIAKVTGQLKDLSSNLSDILMVSGGGGGGYLVGENAYAGADAGGISGSGGNSGNQSTGYAFGQGESGTNKSGGGSGLYGGYKSNA